MGAALENLFKDLKPIHIPPVSEWPPINPDTLWVNYDAEMDDLVIYFSEEAKRGIHVYQSNGAYVVVSRESHVPVGLHFEKWEENYVANDTGLSTMWSEIRDATNLEEGWSQSMRAFGASVSLKMQYIDRTHQVESPLALAV